MFQCMSSCMSHNAQVNRQQLVSTNAVGPVMKLHSDIGSIRPSDVGCQCQEAIPGIR